MNTNPGLSIVIRTLNEQKWLPSVLKSLKNQTYKNIEICIIDSGSTDDTLLIADSYKCKILKIKQDEFTYPYALNVGIAETSGEIIGILSGHSVPVSNEWATVGIEHFVDIGVAGVSGPIQSLPDAKIREKLKQNLSNRFMQLIPKSIIEHGSLDNRNSMIRKSDWQEYNFDEVLVEGCEDYDWSKYLTVKMHKKIIFDPKFQVQHSHSGIGKSSDIEMWSKWREIKKNINTRYKQ